MSAPPESHHAEDPGDEIIVILDDQVFAAEPEPRNRPDPAAGPARAESAGEQRVRGVPSPGTRNAPSSRPPPRASRAKGAPPAPERGIRAAERNGSAPRRQRARPRSTPPARKRTRRARVEEPSSSSREKPAGRLAWMPRIYLVTGGAVTVALVLLFIAGASYYTLPFAARPFHDQHQVFRPSGEFGLTLGIAGTALMVLNLTYLARRQLISLEWLGSLRSWMAFHVLTGLVGPALILFHTAFAPTSYLGMLALCAMLVVVFAGVFGRYIYAVVPRSLSGRELELEDIRERLAGYRAQLSRLGVDAGLLDRDVAMDPGAGRSGLIGTLIGVLFGDPENRRQYRHLRRGLPELS